MRAIKLTVHVGGDHTLHLQLPPDIEGPAEVIVLLPEQHAKSSPMGLEDYLRRLREGPRRILSKEEIDKYLEEERAGWER